MPSQGGFGSQRTSLGLGALDLYRWPKRPQRVPSRVQSLRPKALLSFRGRFFPRCRPGSNPSAVPRPAEGKDRVRRCKTPRRGSRSVHPKYYCGPLESFLQSILLCPLADRGRSRNLLKYVTILALSNVFSLPRLLKLSGSPSFAVHASGTPSTSP
ncbi:hypothetical protein BV20DRAFT_575974 [Pilatotrama ljubarskyi]|nr:hypothetical protein BV20DRAFT_575974 [Pilatotrama ljubarskyi]